MQSNENRTPRKKSKRKQTDRRQSSGRAPRPAPARRIARWPYLHDFKLYISEIPICRAPTPRYEMKRNKTGTERGGARSEKSKSKLKNKKLTRSQPGGRVQCLRPSFDAVGNKNTRPPSTCINMCDGIDWKWTCVGGVGGGAGIEGERR